MPNEELMKFAEDPFLEIRATEWGINTNKQLGRTYLKF